MKQNVLTTLLAFALLAAFVAGLLAGYPAVRDISDNRSESPGEVNYHRG